MEQLLEAFHKNDKRGQGKITIPELKSLLSMLDEPNFWTDDKLEQLIQGTVGTADDGSLAFDAFLRSLYRRAESNPDYAAVREDLKKLMDSPDWDDGSYAPVLIRLAWHSSGTYSKVDSTGGSNGATMRHTLEANDPENVGLDKARQYLEPVKEKYRWLSYADLWILAAYVAIEHTGGPVIPFQGGRSDRPADKAIAPGRLPGAAHGLKEGYPIDAEGRFEGWENLAQHIRDVFGRMGLSERDSVALLCGGHVYGRCHPELSGFAGAWVENPTMFSNEYAADMVGDKWIAVMHDTKLPDGGPVPEEVRPAPGKPQYIDLSKYMPEEEETQARQAPDATEYPPGKYRCVSTWVNCREMPDTSSPIIGRFNQDETLQLVSVKIFGTAVRGLAERGGWVSIIASGGKTLFERIGDFDAQELRGSFRAVSPAGAPVYSAPEATDFTVRVPYLEEFTVDELAFGSQGESQGAIYGKRADSGVGQGLWVLLYSASVGLASEKIVEGYNTKPRKPIKGQTGHQMMLVSDMVLLWDEGFRPILQEYADDEELLKKDFGEAFKRLTDLGCPWSTVSAGPEGGCPAVTASSVNCPVLAAAK
eukprot:TRINITY_DN18909_c0_g2_i1.p1 TRINITY_DN18909_c0_g2~~TRINITY_DN18909_c0_g2_i1.p1  ORF type:complete len:610 (-),score=105.09 TRINITY_DN18909_c0_g2_i1:107-1879(-)